MNDDRELMLSTYDSVPLTDSVWKSLDFDTSGGITLLNQCNQKTMETIITTRLQKDLFPLNQFGSNCAQIFWYRPNKKKQYFTPQSTVAAY